MPVSSQFQVYNASAGSGNTFTLVKEYLRILLSTKDSFRFQNILAITFTNKAAAEMKERVLKSLQDFSEGNEKALLSILETEIKLPQDVLKIRAKLVLNSILQNYSAFNITTIDSFTHRLIRSFAFDLGLSMNFDVEMDSGALLDEAVDVLISKIGEDKDLTQVLIDYSLDKTDDDKSWDISNDLKDFANILLNENHVSNLRLIENKSIEDFSKLKKQLKKEIATIQKELTEIGKQGLEIIETTGLDPKDFYRSMLPTHFLNLAFDLTKAKFFDQSKLKDRIDEHNFYAKSKSEDIKATIESILPSLLELYSNAEKLYQKDVLNNLVLKSLIPLAVLKQINSSLQEIKDQNNIRLISEFNQLISDKIKDEPAPFIYERIGEKFKYYFIDEMQDTSQFQWQNLIPLIENALVSESISGDKGSLMLVGDAKQAIYRWRGGKAEQFIDLYQEEKQDPFSISKEVKNLDTNYRSCAEIIEFNNQFFTHISDFLGSESYKELYINGNHQEKTEKNGGYVQLSFVEIEKADKEKALAFPKQVFSIIQKLDPSFKKRDICVLVRTRKQGMEVSDYLASMNISIVSSETLLLKNNEGIDFIINILVSIQFPEKKDAMANALYFIGKSNSKAIHQFINDRIHLENNTIFQSLLDIGFEFDQYEFSSLPFYDGLEYLLRSFKLVHGIDVFIQSFLDFVLEYEQKRGFGLNDFLEHWERKQNSLSVSVPEGQDAVKIMTIHKSKGLEFPVVIFPYDLDIYREVKPKIWYDGLGSKDFLGFESSLIDFSKKVSYIDEIGTKAYNKRREELELDNLNLLYVALTRPVEQLYIISQKNGKEKELEEATSYAHLFIDFLKNNSKDTAWSEEEIVYHFGNPKRTNLETKDTQEYNLIMPEKFISSSWKNQNISIVANSSKLWDSENEVAIDYGNLVHEILSKIKTFNEVNEVIEKYLFEGFLDSERALELEEIINSIVNHPLLKGYYKEGIAIINEQEMISQDKLIQIPDRLVVEDGKMTILDYKTGKPHKKYEVQLQNYALTLSNMGYDVERKILVYIDTQISVNFVL